MSQGFVVHLARPLTPRKKHPHMRMFLIICIYSPISTTFLRPVSPLAIRIIDLGTAKCVLNNSISALFAAPSTGAAVSFILSVPSAIFPTTSLRDDRGMTRI